MSQNDNPESLIVLKGKAGLRKSDRTQQSILDAALKFLWTNPYRKLTVNELMSLAGSSRSVFYRYYADLPTMMEHLLNELQEKTIAGTKPWFTEEGDPVLLLKESLANLVKVTYEYGPILRAVTDAAPMHERLEKAWALFVQNFNDAVTDRIEQHQALGLIKPFDARPVATALNLMDADLVRHHFGRLPRSNQASVLDAILRVWVATLYGDSGINICCADKKTSVNQK